MLNPKSPRNIKEDPTGEISKGSLAYGKVYTVEKNYLERIWVNNYEWFPDRWMLAPTLPRNYTRRKA